MCSSVKYIVHPSHLGLAYGVIASIVGLAGMIAPLMIGFILSTDPILANSYKNFTLFLFCVSLVSLSITGYILCGPFALIDANSSDN